jgi:hypothetical protein
VGGSRGLGGTGTNIVAGGCLAAVGDLAPRRTMQGSVGRPVVKSPSARRRDGLRNLPVQADRPHSSKACYAGRLDRADKDIASPLDAAARLRHVEGLGDVARASTAPDLRFSL